MVARSRSSNAVRMLEKTVAQPVPGGGKFVHKEDRMACAAGVEAGVYVEEAVSLHIASVSALEPKHHCHLKIKGEVPY